MSDKTRKRSQSANSDNAPQSQTQAGQFADDEQLLQALEASQRQLQALVRQSAESLTIRSFYPVERKRWNCDSPRGRTKLH